MIFFLLPLPHSIREASTTTTTTTELTTEVTSTEPQPYEYVTFDPLFNEIAGDSYINRPHLNVAYSTSRATECARYYVSMIVLVLVPFTKIYRYSGDNGFAETSALFEF